MELQELRSMIQRNNRQIRRIVPEGVSGSAEAFQALTKDVTTQAANSQLTLRQAQLALSATHKALGELARRANPGSERRGYVVLMRNVLSELREVTQRLLNAQGTDYKPITGALRASSGSLSDALKRAQQTISHLNNAAAMLRSFSAIVSALR